MPIVVAQVKSDFINSNVTVSVTLSPAATANSLLFCAYNCNNQDVTNIGEPPAGFTELGSGVQSGTVFPNAMRAAYKVASGGETAISVTGTTQNRRCLVCFEVTGLTTSPFGSFAFSNSGPISDPIVGTTHQLASLNNPVADSIFLSVVSIGTDTANPEVWVGSWGSSFTNQAAFGTTAAANNMAMSAGSLIASSTATRTTSRSWTTTVKHVGILAVFKASGTPAAPVSRPPRTLVSRLASHPQ